MWIHEHKCSVEQYYTGFLIFHHDLRYKIRLDFYTKSMEENEIIDSPKLKYRSYLLPKSLGIYRVVTITVSGSLKTPHLFRRCRQYAKQKKLVFSIKQFREGNARFVLKIVIKTATITRRSTV